MGGERWGAWTTTGVVLGSVVATTVAGVLFALLRLWGRSMVAPICAHIATNSLAFAAALVAIEILD